MEIEKIKQLLKELKLTQRELAKKIDVDERYVAIWINRKSIPKAHLKKVAKALGTTTDYLLD